MDPLLLGTSCVGGGPYPHPGVGALDWGQPGWNGASLELTIIHPGRPVLYQPTSLCLTGRSARRGPPPGGGYSPRGLCSVALRLRHAASGPHDASWGNLPT